MNHVFIFVPGFGQIVTATTFLATHALRDHLHSKGMGTGITSLSFPDIAELRSMAMTIWYDTMPDVNHLLFIDADMGFDPDTVDRLVASADPTDRPIVGGLAFAQKSDGAGPMFARRYRCTPTLYQMRETDTEVGFIPMFDYPREALTEVDATGAACVLIHRSVLEKIRADYGDRWFHPIEVPKGPDGRTEFGEDMSFCLRAKACGFPIYVDTSVKTTHDKGGVFLDEEFYDRQQARLAPVS